MTDEKTETDMDDDAETQNQKETSQENEQTSPLTKDELDDEQKTIFENLVSEQLKDIKSKLDNAYKERDNARKESKRIQDEAKKAKIARLEAEGKELEAAKLKNADLEAQVTSMRDQLDVVTKDSKLAGALSALEFRNKKSREMAFKDISNSLLRQDDGSWTTVDGTSIEEYVSAYASQEDNAFLFKPKVSSGSGLPKSAANAGVANAKPQSLFNLSQDEVLKMAAEGKLKKG